MNKNRKIEAPPQWWDDLINGTTEDSHRVRESLILHYQFLVEAIARKLKSRLPSWILDEDLISYGQIGLIKAVDRYDPTIGPFRSFASTYIHGAIMDELRAQDWAPRGLRRDQQLITRTTADLHNGDNSPKSSIVAEALGWTEHKLESTQRRIDNVRPKPWDTIAHDEHEESHSVEASVSANRLCDLFAEVYEGLPPVAQVILARRYFLQETMSSVSTHTGMNAATVREIHLATVELIYDKVYSSVS